MNVLADLLFSKYRRQVLMLLLQQPEQAYHVREIARLTGTQPGTLHKELSKLADAGILNRREQGNQLWYQANQQCPIFTELASILRKTSDLTDQLRQALLPAAAQLKCVAVFGSVASGKANPHSDIDVLLIGTLSFAEAVKLLYPLQQQLGRDINPQLYSESEWMQALAAHSGFIRELLQSPLLMVQGDKDDLRRMTLDNHLKQLGRHDAGMD